MVHGPDVRLILEVETLHVQDVLSRVLGGEGIHRSGCSLDPAAANERRDIFPTNHVGKHVIGHVFVRHPAEDPFAGVEDHVVFRQTAVSGSRTDGGGTFSRRIWMVYLATLMPSQISLVGPAWMAEVMLARNPGKGAS